MLYAVVPAGGLGTRLGNQKHSKELLPVAGLPVIEYVLQRLSFLKLAKIFVTLAPDKLDLTHYLTHTSPHRRLIELIAGPRRGLLDGIVSPAKKLGKLDQLYFGLPDTIWFPEDGYPQLDMAAPLALGLMPSATPQLFGSVSLDQTGLVTSIVEKPSTAVSPWIWAYGRIRVDAVRELDPTLDFTSALGKFAKHSHVAATPFPDGEYLDIGTPESYAQACLKLENKNVR
jgi:dTDP-glucose pyrophosphorylase